MNVTLKQLLETVILTGATDLYVATGASPTIRFRGEITTLNINPLTAHAVEQMLMQLLPDEMKVKFSREKALDVSLDIQGIGHFQISLLIKQNRISMAAHVLTGAVAVSKSVQKVLLFAEDDEATHLMTSRPAPVSVQESAPQSAPDPWQTGLMHKRKHLLDKLKKTA